MATPMSDPAQQESGLAIPPELMLKMIKGISGFNWADSWNLRLTSHTWKFEVEKLFRQRYLPNMTIKASAQMQGEYNYKFEFAEEISGERAVFKLPGAAVSAHVWKEIVKNLRLRSTGLRHFEVYMISVPELYVVNNTELVGLQEDDSAQSISIKWLPTLDILLREECKLREFIRADVERDLRERFAFLPKSDGIQDTMTAKGILYYMKHKDTHYQRRLLTKVRKMRNGSPQDANQDVAYPDWGGHGVPWQIRRMPEERAKFKLKAHWLSW